MSKSPKVNHVLNHFHVTLQLTDTWMWLNTWATSSCVGADIMSSTPHSCNINGDIHGWHIEHFTSLLLAQSTKRCVSTNRCSTSSLSYKCKSTCRDFTTRDRFHFHVNTLLLLCYWWLLEELTLETSIDSVIDFEEKELFNAESQTMSELQCCE